LICVFIKTKYYRALVASSSVKKEMASKIDPIQAAVREGVDISEIETKLGEISDLNLNPDIMRRVRERRRNRSRSKIDPPSLHEMSYKCYNDSDPCKIHPCEFVDSIYSALNGLEGKIRSTLKELKYNCCYASCREPDGTLRLCKRKWLKTTSQKRVCKGHQNIVEFGEDKNFALRQIDHISHPLSEDHKIKFPTRVYVGTDTTEGFVVREKEHLSLILERANRKRDEIWVSSATKRDKAFDRDEYLQQIRDNEDGMIEKVEEITTSIQNMERDKSSVTDQKLNELYEAAVQLPSNYASMLLGLLLVIVLFFNKETTYDPQFV